MLPVTHTSLRALDSNLMQRIGWEAVAVSIMRTDMKERAEGRGGNKFSLGIGPALYTLSSSRKNSERQLPFHFRRQSLLDPFNELYRRKLGHHVRKARDIPTFCFYHCSK